MINNRNIMFGYGSILVEYDMYKLVLTHIQPQRLIGENISKDSKVEELKTIVFKHNLFDLLDKLCNVDETNCKFEFCDYVFDFSKFNKESVDIVMIGLKKALSCIDIAFAS